MTTPINDGGPAFPCDPFIASKPGNESVAKRLAEGMSLRDAFAISVTGDIWSAYQSDGTAREYDDWRDGVAVEAYRLADSMLRARSQGETDAS